MLRRLKNFFSTLFSPRQEPSAQGNTIHLAIFMETDKGTGGPFVTHIVETLQQISGRVVAVQYFIELSTRSQLRSAAHSIQSNHTDLILAIGPDPTENVIQLRTEGEIKAPIVVLAYEGTHVPLMPRTKVLFYPDTTDRLVTLFQLYGKPLKQVIIAVQRSKIDTIPMFINLVAALKKGNINVVLLPIDEVRDTLPAFMAAHGKVSQLLYVAPDGPALACQKELIELAAEYNCATVATGIGALADGAHVFAAIDYQDIVLDAARTLLKTFQGTSSWQWRLQRAPITIHFSRQHERPSIDGIEKLAAMISSEDRLIL